MSSIPFDRRSLLKYDATHRVLICRECKYAIQKSALESHLLRHKIYRGERRRLLAAIAHLDILDPDDVQNPPAGSRPLDGLPIISGFKCIAADGCGSVCASSKRMRRHWSETHGVSDPSPDGAFFRVTSLQTLFKGTKLRYFEVAPPSDRDVAHEDEDADDNEHVDDPDPVATPPPQPPSPGTLVPGAQLDLETLRYLHHFTIATSLTLPRPPSNTHDQRRYWQTDAVTQAMQHTWLACGLLAISASHMYAIAPSSESSEDTTLALAAKQHHLNRSAHLWQEFSTGWAALRRALSSFQADNVTHGPKLAAQMACIQQLFHWTLPLVPEPDESAALAKCGSQAPFQLRSFNQAIQGCANPDFALRSLGLVRIGTDDVDSQRILRVDDQVRGEDDDPGGGGRSTGQHSNNTTPSIRAPDPNPNTAPRELTNRLRALPFRMSNATAKPDSALDFFAALAAIDALVECCSLSYDDHQFSSSSSSNSNPVSDKGEATWSGMASWPTKVSEHFAQMVWRRNPAALVVFAHWSLLVERAAGEGRYWFLKGLAAKVRDKVAEELPEGDKAHGLIEDLL
ncbi:hypothetical protein B0H63DRAFT_392579 [Podospora didyma]|uniref:C2H2-type domain-containing protein n=1 Tax=Podospora didyma TaxID=330526 RepID=A0AAE0NUT4_9PEZI|nr:hypothetical protein B0H63DRAFT_392579 [Podospora didyma]